MSIELTLRKKQVVYSNFLVKRVWLHQGSSNFFEKLVLTYSSTAQSPILVMVLANYNLAAKCIAVLSLIAHPKLAKMRLSPFWHEIKQLEPFFFYTIVLGNVSSANYNLCENPYKYW